MSRKRSFWCRNGHFAVILAVFWLSFGSFDAFWLSFWQFWRILAVFLVNLAVFSSIWCHFGCFLDKLAVFSSFLVYLAVSSSFLVYLAVFSCIWLYFPCIWLYSRVSGCIPVYPPIPHGRTPYPMAVPTPIPTTGYHTPWHHPRVPMLPHGAAGYAHLSCSPGFFRFEHEDANDTFRVHIRNPCQKWQNQIWIATGFCQNGGFFVTFWRICRVFGHFDTFEPNIRIMGPWVWGVGVWITRKDKKTRSFSWNPWWKDSQLSPCCTFS